MPKKKSSKPAATKSVKPRTFTGVVRGCSRPIQVIANSLRDLVYEEIPDAEERFHAGHRPIAMYRTSADVCWIQPHKAHCNIYFTRGTELNDPDQILEGSSDRFKHAKIRTLDDLEQLPLREWISASVALNEATINSGIGFDEVMQRMQTICLALPNTKETLTWGIPHFRVGEKIFCGCSEDKARPRIGLKMEAYQSEVMMKLPGIEKSPYSRKGDGWVTIDPGVFDDWDEIEQLLIGSYRLIAPKRLVAQLDSDGDEPAAPRRRKSTNRSR